MATIPLTKIKMENDVARNRELANELATDSRKIQTIKLFKKNDGSGYWLITKGNPHST